MDKSEQWKLGGKCSLCRRKKYCGSPCTANKRKGEAFIRNTVAAAMYGIFLCCHNDVEKIKHDKIERQLRRMSGEESDV